MFVSCPDPACHAPAEILDRYPLGSTDGLWEHVRTYCVRRHVYVLPTERVPGVGFREPTPERGTSEAEATPSGIREPTPERGTSEAEATPRIGPGPDCSRPRSDSGISPTSLELIPREVRNSKWECGA
jgi:hypothetical protein